MDKVEKIEMLVLGNRDFPLSPTVKLRGDLTAPLAAIVEQAEERMPGIGVSDVLKLLVRIGLSQVDNIFAAGGRIEPEGRISFLPLTEGRKSAKVTALRLRLQESGVLAATSLGEREAIPEHTKPVNTIPNPVEQPDPMAQP